MIFGIQSNVWGEKYHREFLPQMIAEVALAGYDGLEIGAHRLGDLSQPQAFDELVKRHGLHVSGIHMLGKYLLAEALEGRFDYPRQVADFTAEVGAQYLLYSGDHKAEGTTRDQQDLAAVLNAVGRICQTRGLTCCFHNHWWEIENNQAELRAICELTDPALVSLCLDIGWVARAGAAPVKVLGEFLERVKYLHLKDTLDDRWTEVGYGTVDFEGVLQVVAGAEGIYLTVERDEPLPEALESARKSLETLRKLTT